MSVFQMTKHSEGKNVAMSNGTLKGLNLKTFVQGKGDFTKK